MKALLKFLLNFVVTVIHVSAISSIWNWFLVPMGVPPIKLIHAYILILLIRLFTVTGADFGKKRLDSIYSDDADKQHSLLTAGIFYALVWGIGWIVHSFIFLG